MPRVESRSREEIVPEPLIAGPLSAPGELDCLPPHCPAWCDGDELQEHLEMECDGSPHTHFAGGGEGLLHEIRHGDRTLRPRSGWDLTATQPRRHGSIPLLRLNVDGQLTTAEARALASHILAMADRIDPDE